MGTRAHDLDINPGGDFVIDGDTDITKFGFDYDPATDLFATLLRVRNTNCEGFSPCDFTVPPFDTPTVALLRVASGSSDVPEIGQFTAHDNSTAVYRSGTIASGLIEAFDMGIIGVGHDLSQGDPLLDGVVVGPGVQTITLNTVHQVQFILVDTGETETINVIVHKTGTSDHGALVIINTDGVP